MPSKLPENGTKSEGSSKDGAGDRGSDGALQSLVRVESLIQLGLLLPACLVIGWALGLALDHWLNRHWINVVGLIAGAIAGFVQTIRIVLSHSKE